MKCYLTEHDTFNYTVYTEKEAYEEFLFEVEDLNADLPEELIEEYKKVAKKFWDLNYKIKVLTNVGV